jgi:hypothetical protein
MLLLPVLLMISSASPTKIAVVDLDAPDAMTGLSLQVSRQVSDAAGAQKLSVIGPEELRIKLDAKAYASLKKCAGQAVCVSQYLIGQGAKKAVTGAINRDEKNYLVKLWLFNLETGQVEASIDRSILIASRRLQKDIQEALPGFLRGEKESIGTVVVDSNVRDVQIFLNGEFVGVTPTTLRLKSGKYELKLDKKRYFPLQRFVDIDAAKPTTARFDMQLKPGELADKDDIPPLAAAVEKQTPFSLSAPTWIFAGITVGALATGAVFGALSSQRVQTLKGGYDA